MCADLDVLRHFKHNVLALELADDEIVAIVRRAEVEKLRRTLDLLIPDEGVSTSENENEATS